MISLGPLNTPAYSRAGFKEQEGAELGQAQVKLEVKVDIGVQLLVRVGAWGFDGEGKNKINAILNLSKVVVEVEVSIELGNILCSA